MTSKGLRIAILSFILLICKIFTICEACRFFLYLKEGLGIFLIGDRPPWPGRRGGEGPIKGVPPLLDMLLVKIGSVIDDKQAGAELGQAQLKLGLNCN